MNAIESNRHQTVSLILDCLRDLLGATSVPPKNWDEDLELLGPGSVLDSIGLVTLIVDVEQRVAQEHDMIVTLASEAAMSRRSSPFRTVGSFADYICELVKDSQPNA